MARMCVGLSLLLWKKLLQSFCGKMYNCNRTSHCVKICQGLIAPGLRPKNSLAPLVSKWYCKYTNIAIYKWHVMLVVWGMCPNKLPTSSSQLTQADSAYSSSPWPHQCYLECVQVSGQWGQGHISILTTMDYLSVRMGKGLRVPLGHFKEKELTMKWLAQNHNSPRTDYNLILHFTAHSARFWANE